MLANYPNRDGRIGNGVGLDTPAGAVEVLTRAGERRATRWRACRATAQALIDRLLAGPTNSLAAARRGGETLDAGDAYRGLLRRAAADGARRGRRALGRARGRSVLRRRRASGCRCCASATSSSPSSRRAATTSIRPASYHDPDLVPPHGYLAFYAWLRREFGAHAVVHMGKHGNLEWLPGKALALSAECWPEAALGPLPHLYPFIVNDPGEGSQAKRRAAAVIVDHLTPPLTRAESYGPLRDLERLVDEYYEAAGLDPRRCTAAARADPRPRPQPAASTRTAAWRRREAPEAALGKLDTHLCELKELQIRDGLHVFGRSPEASSSPTCWWR